VAELQKAPTVEDGMIPKILKALDAGFMPGTTEYFQALGASAKDRGIAASTDLPPIISGLRDKFSRDAQKLAQEQATLQDVGIGILKELGQQTAQLKVKQDFARANAPTYAEAEQYGLGLKPPMTIPSQQEALGPGAPMPFQPQGMSTEPLAGIPQELNPYTMEPTRQFNPRTNEIVSRGKLTAPSLEPAMVEGPRPMGTVYGPDMQAKISPFEQALTDDITQGRGVMQDGKYVPMQLAKPPANLLSPEQISVLLQAAEDPNAPIDIPLPATSVNQLLQRQKPLAHNMGTYIESLAAVESKNKYGKAMTFMQLTDKDPGLAQKVRNQAAIQERKDMYNFEQEQLGKRQISVAGPIAEEGAKAREAVQSDVRLSGPTMIMGELTDLVDKLFLPESEGWGARAKHAASLRGRLAIADPEVTKWQKSIATAMRPQLARAEGEVGNLAAQEQLNAGELIPDLMGGTTSMFPFIKLPDTKETAVQRLKLATEFIELASKAPKGERESSQVQQKLRSIKQRLDGLDEKTAKARNQDEKPLGDLSKDEFEYAKNLAAQGLSKTRVEALIRERRTQK
jgi:hypothetical protein